MSTPPFHLIRTKCWVRVATPQARRIVLDLFRAVGPEAALSTHRIHEECLKVDARVPPQFIPPIAQVDPKTAVSVPQDTLVPSPTHPFHPIRSVAYLKRVVLADLEERGIVQKVHHVRAPNEDEMRDLAKHAASIERRNKRRVSQDLRPTGVPPTMVTVWEWVLTDHGKKLLFTKKGAALHETGEIDGEADHLDAEQITEIKAAPWAVRPDAYGFWVAPSRGVTGLPALHPASYIDAQAKAARRRQSRANFGINASPRRGGSENDAGYVFRPRLGGVMKWTPPDGDLPYPSWSSASSPPTKTPEEVPTYASRTGQGGVWERTPADRDLPGRSSSSVPPPPTKTPGAARVWVQGRGVLPNPRSSSVPSPSTKAPRTVAASAVQEARVWVPGHGELPKPSSSAVPSPSTTTPGRHAALSSGTSFGLRASSRGGFTVPIPSSFPYASSVQAERPTMYNRETAPPARGTPPHALGSELRKADGRIRQGSPRS